MARNRIKRRRSERDREAQRVSLIGLLVNLILAGAKITAGCLFSALSVMADGFNSLSDATASAVTLISYRVAAMPADQKHPYGHRRMEYFAGVIISFFILLMGAEVAKESVEKIIRPVMPQFHILTVIVLIGSIAVKIGLFLYYRHAARKMEGGSAFAAAGKDSLCDACASTAVLLSTMIAGIFSVDLDGITGFLVSCFILYSGVRAVIETSGPLLGAAPDPEKTAEITRKICSFDGVLGVHDLMIHDYGPGRQFASVHVEMDSRTDMMYSHSVIDDIERYFTERGLNLVAHLDPVVVGDERVDALRVITEKAVRAVDPRMAIHDFRAVVGGPKSKLIFDMEVPFDLERTDEELRDAVTAAIRAQNEAVYTVIDIDRV